MPKLGFEMLQLTFTSNGRSAVTVVQQQRLFSSNGCSAATVVQQ